MSTASTQTAPGAQPTRAPHGAHAAIPTGDAGARNVSFPRLVRSEWIKLWSLRSTWWTLGLTILGMVAFSLIMAASLRAMASFEDAIATESSDVGVTAVTFGYFLGQITVATLGALVITGEYSTGMIRSTFTAAPRRIDALVAKATVLTAVVAATSAIGIALSALVAQPLLSGVGLGLDFSEAITWRALAGAVVYLILVALLAFTLGTIIRSSAGTIAAILGILLMLPVAFQLLSLTGQQWVTDVSHYLPGTAGEALMQTSTTDVMMANGGLEWWQGGLVLLGYVLIAGAIGFTMARTRDA